jgi:hypothetical protein
MVRKGQVVAVVMIGVDPHKGSHTAVALGADEAVLDQVRVRASAAQADRLLTWAKSWPERTWAVEGAGGLGHLLAQELVAAGEQVLDVQPKLAARVRLLASGAVNKNNPDDDPATRSPANCTPRCRGELVPGGVSKQIGVPLASRVLGRPPEAGVAGGHGRRERHRSLS